MNEVNRSPIPDTRPPGLRRALDVESLLVSLRAALARQDRPVDPESIRVADVRYRPGGPCWILYKVKLRDAQGHSHRQHLAGLLLRQGQKPEALPAKLVEHYAKLPDRLFDEPMLVLPDPPLAFYPFPLDASLPGLVQAVNGQRVGQLLERIWSAQRLHVKEVRCSLLGYTPHARAALRYDVLCRSARDGSYQLRRLVGKMHARKSASRLHADAWALWQAAKGRVELAPPVGLLGPAEVTLQEEVRGERLGGLVDHSDFQAHARRTARLLAAFHGLSLPLGGRRSPAEEANTVHRWGGVVQAIRPELRARASDLCQKLASDVEARTRPSGPIHADFHHTNLLVDGSTITIIDTDEMAFGDPMVDVGRFMASLRVPARRAFGDIHALDEAREVFLAEYLRRADGDERQARLFEAASLLISAGSSFRIQREGWEEEVELLLDECERLFAASQPSWRPSTPLTERQAPPSDAERRKWVADSIYLRARLYSSVRESYGADLVSCRTRRGEDPHHDERLHLRLQGELEGQPWEKELQAVFWKKNGGLSALRRLEQLRDAMDDVDGAPLLPKPVVYLKDLRLAVWEEPPRGARLSELLGQPEALDAAKALAIALASIHEAPVRFDRIKKPHDEAAALRRQVQKLRRKRPDFDGPWVGLSEAVQERIGSLSEPVVPSLRTVHPHHVLWKDGRIIVGRADELTLAHPYVDAADFLARIHWAGQRNGSSDQARRAADCFRTAVRARGADCEALDILEAAGHLRLACIQLGRDAELERVRPLLDHAARLVGN